MRAIYSYGVAAVIVVAGAAWLATGTLVTGGNGPGNGERPIMSLIDKDAKVAENTHHEAGGIDPVAPADLAREALDIANHVRAGTGQPDISGVDPQLIQEMQNPDLLFDRRGTHGR